VTRSGNQPTILRKGKVAIGTSDLIQKTSVSGLIYCIKLVFGPGSDPNADSAGISG
jgi:hypothetical protein